MVTMWLDFKIILSHFKGTVKGSDSTTDFSHSASLGFAIDRSLDLSAHPSRHSIPAIKSRTVLSGRKSRSGFDGSGAKPYPS